MNALNRIPMTIFAGDSYNISLPPIPGYDASYAPALVLRGVNIFKTNGTIAGDGTISFTLTTQNTSTLTGGLYEWAIQMTKAGQRVTALVGTLKVSGNETPRISELTQRLSLIDDVLNGRITDDVSSFSIGGTSLQHLSVDELLSLKLHYTKELYKLNNGGALPSPKTVRLSFPGVR